MPLGVHLVLPEEQLAPALAHLVHMEHLVQKGHHVPWMPLAPLEHVGHPEHLVLEHPKHLVLGHLQHLVL